MSNAERGVLLIGADFQAVGVMRALAAENIPCFLLASERGIAVHSRHARRQVRKYDLLEDPDAIAYLKKLAESEGLVGWVVFCVNDETIEFLAKNHAELSETFVSAVPPWVIAQNFYEKDKAYALADSCGIPIPRQYTSESVDCIVNANPDYPLVLKPTFKKNYYDKTKNKAILVKDESELRLQYAAMRSLIPASQIVVQEMIEGGTRNLFSYATLFDGERIVSGLAAARLRQHPMDFGHATTYAERRENDELEQLATRFLRALKYKGVAEVEFMLDEKSGKYKFIEMNGRFWGWHVLTQVAGLNFPADLYRLMLGLPVKWEKPTVQDARWMRMITDVPTVLREVVRGRMSVREYWPTLTARKGFAVWSWSDPLPSIVEVLMAPYLWLKKGF
jgi:predicted ATP-grasp superfamily ATP-dependent carboligase